MLNTVLLVAELGKELPLWRVPETELAIVRAAWPGWSIRRAEHGPGWFATRGGPPVLLGRTRGRLAERIAAHGGDH